MMQGARDVTRVGVAQSPESWRRWANGVLGVDPIHAVLALCYNLK